MKKSEQNHTGAVAKILHYSLDLPPATSSIIQYDFIEFFFDDTYTPNTITYIFDEIVSQDIIVAPHTQYHVAMTMKFKNFDEMLLPLHS